MTTSQDAHAAAPSSASPLIVALSDTALLRASGSAIFQRGQKYATSDAVTVTKASSGATPKIFATVMGTDRYRTEVWVRGGEVGGACTCPSAYDDDFCKHQVALALVWRRRLGGDAPTSDDAAPPLPKEARGKGQDKRHALHDFLQGLSRDELAARLMALADGNRDIARDLQQWRLSSEVPASAAEAKALVTRLIAPGRTFIAWHEGREYVQRAEAVLPLLAKARDRDPAGAVALCLHAMRRGWAVLAHADDSDGVVGDFVADLGAEWVASLQGAGPQPAAFGNSYLKLRLEDPFGCFDSAAAEAAMGEAALARYRAALAQCWQEAGDADRAKHAAPDDPAFDIGLTMLRSWHVEQLEAAGDVDAALAVLRRDIRSPYGHCEVTECLERHGRLREAFANAELAHRTFPDDVRVQDALLRCYERDGWTAEALAMRRRRFDASPSEETYRQVLRAGEAAGCDVPALRHELQAALVAAEDRDMARGARWSARRGASVVASGERDVTLRASILCDEARWDEAVALVQPPAHCHERVLAFLARQLGADRVEDRVELLIRVFEREMAEAKSPYRRPIERVGEILALLDPVARATWLAKLRVGYKGKRTFVQALPGV